MKREREGGGGGRSFQAVTSHLRAQHMYLNNACTMPSQKAKQKQKIELKKTHSPQKCGA